VQMKAMEWSQDAEGKDKYTDTQEIIFFPKIMTLEKNENKIIRAGITIPAVAKEKTFRLFIEEIPEPRKKEGTNVAIAIRFGVPIFAKPLKEVTSGEIGKTGMTNDKLSFVVSNTGNVHFRITSILATEKDAKGKTLFSKELDGWYLLNGASRTYSVNIPKDKCVPGATIEVAVKSDNLNLSKNLNIEKSMCFP
jgi:fimbrial chaperone protein